MRVSCLILSFLVVLAFAVLGNSTAWSREVQGPVAPGQSTSAGPPGPPGDDQGDSFRENMKRMEIKREEDEHRKLVERAAQIKETVDTLSHDAAGSHLAHTADKKLKDIEKSAKTIRSEFGGTNDETPLDSPPANLEDALKQLKSTGERLNTSMEKTSRHVVSATVVVEAGEIIQLVKIIRTYVN
jgi:hypothetical protein